MYVLTLYQKGYYLSAIWEIANSIFFVEQRNSVQIFIKNKSDACKRSKDKLLQMM